MNKSDETCPKCGGELKKSKREFSAKFTLGELSGAACEECNRFKFDNLSLEKINELCKKINEIKEELENEKPNMDDWDNPDVPMAELEKIQSDKKER